jgi:hypothetical protein
MVPDSPEHRGRGRSFAGPADSKAQPSAWLAQAHRYRRRLGCRPADWWEAGKEPMLALPPVVPVTGWWRREHIAYMLERLRGRYARVRVGTGTAGSSESRGTVLNVVLS